MGGGLSRRAGSEAFAWVYPLVSHVRRAWAPCPDRAAPSARSPGRAGKRSPNVKMPSVSGRVPRLAHGGRKDPTARTPLFAGIAPTLAPEEPFRSNRRFGIELNFSASAPSGVEGY